jgi:hypothetical protein
MSLPPLDNLVGINKLKAEARDAGEIGRFIAMANTQLADARQQAVSLQGRYTSAYTAAHVIALAALRWHGYRSENRYIVFQCLEHTVGWPPQRWRTLAQAHAARNRAEYEGYFELQDRDLDALIQATQALLQDVRKLTGM